MVKQVPVFRNLTDMERSTLPARSGKLFTLASLYNATLVLLAESSDRELEQQIELAVRFWNAVSAYIPDWDLVLQRRVSASEIRRDYVHCHAIALSSLGAVGAMLISLYPESWEAQLEGLRSIDWSRSNPDWEGRILSKSGFSQSRASVSWMGGYIKQRLGLPLNLDEEVLESTRVLSGR